MNIKGRLPIIRELLYNIPVEVFDKTTGKIRKDRARLIKKKGKSPQYEFANKGNTLGLFNRFKGKMYIFSANGQDYQPMEFNLDENKFFLPDYPLEDWREMEQRRSLEQNKPKADAQKELIKFIGIGICSFLIIIALANFITSVPLIAPSCNCNVQGIDLIKCQEIIANQTTASGGFT